MDTSDVVGAIFQNFLLFLALINPISKVSIFFALGQQFNRTDLIGVARRATLAGFLALVVFALTGNFILQSLFQIKLYSLQLAGGVVLFMVGLHALQHGEFFELRQGETIADISYVPIGLPMIAGPATITASITRSAEFGFPIIAVSLAMALLVNYIAMLLSMPLGSFLERWHLLGPLVRITGLFIAAIGADMAFGALSQWLVTAS